MRKIGFVEVPSRVYERAVKTVGKRYPVVPGRGYAAWVFEAGEVIRLPHHSLALWAKEVVKANREKA